LGDEKMKFIFFLFIFVLVIVSCKGKPKSYELVHSIEKRIQNYYDKEDYKNVILSCDSVLKIQPANALVLELKGISLSCLGRNAEAVQVLTSAIDKGAKNPEEYNFRGMSREKLNDFAGALDDYTSAIFIDSNFVKALNNRGNLLVNNGQYELAEKDLIKALKIDSTVPQFYNNMGRLYSHKGQSEKAFFYYGKGIALEKTDYLLLNRGSERYSLEQYDEAILDYSEAIQLNPYNSDAYLCRAYCYDKLKRKELMFQDLNAAIKMNNFNAQTFYAEKMKELK
jgi:tetratricopeptide (TPR) repeat protein